MAAPPLSKVTPGSDLVIPAAAYNAFVDAAIATRADGGGGGGSSGRMGTSPSVIRVQNNTGAQLDQFDAVALATPAITPADNLGDFRHGGYIPKAEVCSSTNHRGSWGVMLEPVPTGGIGRCCVDGVTICWINIKQQADTAVEIVSGSKIPISNVAGSGQILWVVGGAGSASATGNQWAVIRVGGGVGIPCVEFAKVVTVFGGGNFQIRARPCDASGNFLHSDSSIFVNLFWFGPNRWIVDSVVQFIRFGKFSGIIVDRSGQTSCNAHICVVKITGPPTAGDVYPGNIPPEITVDVPPGTFFISTKFGNALNVIVVNLAELGGASSLVVPEQSMHIGRVLWCNADGTLVVAIRYEWPSLKAPSAAVNPSSPAAGQWYFNTSDHHFYGWNGSAWKQLDN